MNHRITGNAVACGVHILAIGDEYTRQFCASGENLTYWAEPVHIIENDPERTLKLHSNAVPAPPPKVRR
jgi:hypothetical protein